MVTDHRSLVYLSTQDNLSPRQVRWWEFLSRFNFRITYVKGSLNIVADALSRKFEGLPAVQTSPPEDYLSVDKKLDPDGDELPGFTPAGSGQGCSVDSAPEGQIATVTTRLLGAPLEPR